MELLYLSAAIFLKSLRLEDGGAEETGRTLEQTANTKSEVNSIEVIYPENRTGKAVSNQQRVSGRALGRQQSQ